MSDEEVKLRGVVGTFYTNEAPVRFATPNLNGRVYPKEVWQKALEDFHAGGAGRIVTMPADPSNPKLEEAAAEIQELKVEDGLVVGEMITLNTPKGNRLKALLRGQNDLLKCSAMGHGQVNEVIVKHRGFFGWLLNFGAWLLEVLRIRRRPREKIVSSYSISGFALTTDANLPPVERVD